MKSCTRSACRLVVDESDVFGVHRDTGLPYCLGCTRKINRACGQEVVRRSDGEQENWK